jgi:glycolate oxidase
MALARDAYQAIEDAVGAENISEEPGILDSYAFQWLGELLPAAKDRFAVRPETVVLPGSTEEVQTIVRICNQYKIKFKALSTGWGVHTIPGIEVTIQLDLRRMNRILEINERNMYAVVEPYVIGAQLQAELMKRGLNCNIIAAGSNTSALPLTSLVGDGFSSVSNSMHGRNTLGVEWVLPTGELLRLGALGSGAGWFCGDGPGPSLRGIIRGVDAIAGGLGVFTKAATKVYHWPGPPVPQGEGVSPSYTWKPLPDTHCYYILFPSWEKLSEAGIRIGESEIAYILVAMSQFALAANIATSNEEGAQLLSEILEFSKGRPGLLVMISAKSRKEFDYQEKVLRVIMVETEGECLPLLEEGNIQGSLTWRLTRVSAGVRQYFRFTGGYAYFGTMANWDRLPGIRRENNTIREKFVRQGKILDDGNVAGLSTSIEFGHLGASGIEALYDPTDPGAKVALTQISIEASRLGLEKYKYTLPATNAAEHDVLGPQLNNYQLWQRKIKKAFDPNVASDPTNYI